MWTPWPLVIPDVSFLPCCGDVQETAQFTARWCIAKPWLSPPCGVVDGAHQHIADMLNLGIGDGGSMLNEQAAQRAHVALGMGWVNQRGR